MAKRTERRARGPNTVKTTCCGRRLNVIVWGLCQAQSHCYQCGGELSKGTIEQLAEALKGQRPSQEKTCQDT